MTIHFNYESDPIGVFAVCTGVVTGAEIISANEEVSKCDECVYHLLDFSSAIKIDISLEEMHKIAIQDNSIRKSAALEKIAMVGDLNMLEKTFKEYEQFSRDWVGRNKPYVTKLFQNINEARDWINS